MFCTKCGAEIPEAGMGCPKCGAAKSRSVYVLLGWFLGALGIHNFYIGRNQRGVAQLVLSLLCCGLPVAMIWAIVDMFTVKTDAAGDPLGDDKHGFRLAVAGLIGTVVTLAVTVVLIVLLTGMIMPLLGVRHNADYHKNTHCASNLKQIGCGILMYAGDNGGVLPVASEDDNIKHLMESLRDYGLAEACFRCPVADKYTISPYYYCPPRESELEKVKHPSKTPLMYCGLPHDGDKLNMLFADGHVESIDSQRAAEIGLFDTK